MDGKLRFYFYKTLDSNVYVLFSYCTVSFYFLKYKLKHYVIYLFELQLSFGFSWLLNYMCTVASIFNYRIKVER